MTTFANVLALPTDARTFETATTPQASSDSGINPEHADLPPRSVDDQPPEFGEVLANFLLATQVPHTQLQPNASSELESDADLEHAENYTNSVARPPQHKDFDLAAYHDGEDRVLSNILLTDSSVTTLGADTEPANLPAGTPESDAPDPFAAAHVPLGNNRTGTSKDSASSEVTESSEGNDEKTNAEYVNEPPLIKSTSRVGQGLAAEVTVERCHDGKCGSEGISDHDLSTTEPPQDQSLTAKATLAVNTENASHDVSSAFAAGRTFEANSPVTPENIARLGDTIAREIIDRASLVAGPEETRIELELDPPELGRVSVRLSESSEGISARIVVAHEHVWRLLGESLADFQATLADSGIELRDFSMAQRDEESFQDFDEQSPLFSRTRENAASDFPSRPRVQTGSTRVVDIRA